MIQTFRRTVFALSLLMLIPSLLFGQDTLLTSVLKNRTLEELMQMEVTSFSKRAEKAFDVPASIQVITSEDIRRSGATSLPEALRLAPNLDVAQVDSRQWAISARGFNGTTANKLLVLIDGRNVYTPLYSGVFWDAQNVFLEDVDRIEVISGPGATLWGTNAVNGVINVITKNAKDGTSQGLHLASNAGTQERFDGSGRYGLSLGGNGAIREYIMNFNKHDSRLTNGDEANDRWSITQGGFRSDWDVLDNAHLTFQGDVYGGSIRQIAGDDIGVSGENLLERWTQTLDGPKQYSIQAYYDRTHRIIPAVFGEDIETIDLDAQHRFPPGDDHDVVIGAGFRYMNDHVNNSSALAFIPDFLVMRVYSAYIQDEISLFQHQVKFTLGSKFEHNEFSGFEYQPSAKISWLFSSTQMAWGSITRALRTPSRIDRDFYVPQTPPYLLAGGTNFISEKVIAYELGYRTQPYSVLTFEVATFYNLYDDLRSVEPGPPFTLQNGLEGTTYGAEIIFNYQLTDRWRWKTAYSYFQKEIRVKPWSHDVNNGQGEGNDPRHKLKLNSSIDLPGDIEFDAWLRVIDELPNTSARVPGYVEVDIRVGWRAAHGMAFSISGQNLLQDQHHEFGAPATFRDIPRSVYGRITWNR